MVLSRGKFPFQKVSTTRRLEDYLIESPEGKTPDLAAKRGQEERIWGGPMGPATCRAGLGAEWIVTWMLASGPAGSKAKQVAASVETRKHGWHLPHARWRLSQRQRRGRAKRIPQWVFYGTIAAGSIGTIFRHTESSSVSFIRVTVTWCGIGVCGLDVRMQTVWALGRVPLHADGLSSTLYS